MQIALPITGVLGSFFNLAKIPASSRQGQEGGNLAIATRDHGEDEIAASANALGQAIVDALLEVFDGLMQE